MANRILYFSAICYVRTFRRLKTFEHGWYNPDRMKFRGKCEKRADRVS